MKNECIETEDSEQHKVLVMQKHGANFIAFDPPLNLKAKEFYEIFSDESGDLFITNTKGEVIWERSKK